MHLQTFYKQAILNTFKIILTCLISYIFRSTNSNRFKMKIVIGLIFILPLATSKDCSSNQQGKNRYYFGTILF